MTVRHTVRLPVRNKNSDCTGPWAWLVWDDADVPAGAWGSLVDGDAQYGYLHIPSRPHPDDPQSADYWTRQRVYYRWVQGELISTPDGDCEVVSVGVERLDEWKRTPWAWVIGCIKLEKQ